jgi:hypothetical protein
MNTKQKGRRQDFKSIKLMEQYGSVDACISAASLGVFDVIGWGKNGSMFIQNKTNAMPPTGEMIGLVQAIVPCSAIKVLMVWKDHARFPIFYLIDSNGLHPKEKDEAVEIMRKVLHGE